VHEYTGEKVDKPYRQSGAHARSCNYVQFTGIMPAVAPSLSGGGVPSCTSRDHSDYSLWCMWGS